MDALYLTHDELTEQTGLTQGAAQIRALKADGFRKGIHFFVRADGKPRLLRSALEEWSGADAQGRREFQQHLRSQIGKPRKQRAIITMIVQTRSLPVRIGPAPEPKAPYVPKDSAAHARARQRRIRRATPPWANREQIRAIYAQARILTSETGIKHQVDHEIQLCGKTVSGLHVETNLRILTATENARRPRAYTP